MFCGCKSFMKDSIGMMFNEVKLVQGRQNRGHLERSSMSNFLAILQIKAQPHVT